MLPFARVSFNSYSPLGRAEYFDSEEDVGTERDGKGSDVRLHVRQTQRPGASSVAAAAAHDISAATAGIAGTTQAASVQDSTGHDYVPGTTLHMSLGAWRSEAECRSLIDKAHHAASEFVRAVRPAVLVDRIQYQATVDRHNATLAELDNIDARLLSEPGAAAASQAAFKRDKVLSLATAAGAMLTHGGAAVARFVVGDRIDRLAGGASLFVASTQMLSRLVGWNGRSRGEINKDESRLMGFACLIADGAICTYAATSVMENQARTDASGKSAGPWISFGLNVAGLAMTLFELRLRQSGYASSPLMYKDRFGTAVSDEARAAGPIETKPLGTVQIDAGVHLRVHVDAGGNFDLHLEEVDADLLPPMTRIFGLPPLNLMQGE